jgi:chromosome segregation ATPase
VSDGDAAKKTDLTVEILKDIRQELRQTNTRLDAVREELGARIEALGASLGARIDDTNARLDETNTRLDSVARRVVESEIRTATTITDLAHNVHDLTAYLRAQGDLRPRVERCERDIADIQAKLRPAS